MKTIRASVLALAAGIAAMLVVSGCGQGDMSEKYKNRYFVRCLRYDMMDGHVLVTDNKSPRVITLDPWLEVVFAAADGQRTAQQFVAQLEAKYPGGAPTELKGQTYGFLEKMETEGLIRFTDQPMKLPYYLSMPIAKQDKDKALAEMKRDGYIK